MTTDLRQRLDDLLAEVPEHVTAADPAVAWASGRRRRAGRVLAVAAAAVFIASVAALVVPKATTPQPARQPGSSDLTYPVRIERPWRVEDLGARWAPLAGVIERNDRWWAVSQRGEIRRMPVSDPNQPAVVSPNGNKVAYFRPDPEGDLVIANLATALGRQTGISAFDEAPRVLESDAWPSWSPDSRRLLVPLRRPSSDDVPAPPALVVAGPSHTVVRSVPGSSAKPFGWVSPSELGWLDGDRVLVTGIRGGPPIRTVRLDRAPRADERTWLSADGSGWLALVSPKVLTVLDPEGHVVDERKLAASSVASRCPASWSGKRVWVAADGEHEAVILDGGDGRLIQADPSLLSSCSVWADAALRGSAYRGVGARLFGTSTSSLAWHWREYGLSTLGVLLVSLFVVVRRWRRLRSVP